jgi:hypothetical protein
MVGRGHAWTREQVVVRAELPVVQQQREVDVRFPRGRRLSAIGAVDNFFTDIESFQRAFESAVDLMKELERFSCSVIWFCGRCGRSPHFGKLPPVLIHIAELSASFFSVPSGRTLFVMRMEFEVADAVHKRVGH